MDVLAGQTHGASVDRMTLTDIIPSLRASLPPSLNGDVWPAGTRWTGHGGMTDCPTAALYGGAHTAALIGRTSLADLQPATVVGRHNDVDDVVVPTLNLPADVHPGDLLAVAGTGAYHHSRASNYHLVGRPALLGVAGGRTRTLVRRESLTDLLSRDADHSAADGVLS